MVRDASDLIPIPIDTVIEARDNRNAMKGAGQRHGRRRRVLIVLLCIAGLGTFVTYTLTRRPPEPIYQGKPLTYWIGHSGVWYGDTDDPASRVVQEIGTNAIPTLVYYLSKKPSESRQQAAQWLFNHRISWLYYRLDTENRRRYSAACALRTLGQDAQPALQPLVDAIHEDPSSPAWMGIGMIGTNVPETLPTILREFQDPMYRPWLVKVLVGFKDQPEDSVPALIECLKDSRLNVKGLALSSLEKFGTNAQSAIPYVTALTTNTNSMVAMHATRVLTAITPDANESVIEK